MKPKHLSIVVRVLIVSGSMARVKFFPGLLTNLYMQVSCTSNSLQGSDFGRRPLTGWWSPDTHDKESKPYVVSEFPRTPETPQQFSAAPRAVPV